MKEDILSPDELRVVQAIRKLQWGIVEVEVKRGRPVFLRTRTDTKLDESPKKETT